MKRLVSICVPGFYALFFLGCGSQTRLPKNSKPADFYFFQKAKSTAAAPCDWVLLLPGSSGLNIFGDTAHYFAVAGELNRAGFDVLLVDYKKAHAASGMKMKNSAGEKIKLVSLEAINWARKTGRFSENSRGKLVAWSRGGEGVWQILNDRAMTDSLGIVAAALFCPSNRGRVAVKTGLPVLVQVGTADNVTDPADLKNQFLESKNVRVVLYKNAAHGFDVAALEKGKTVRFPPIFGKKYRFQFDSLAAKNSRDELLEFLGRKAS